jgi:hypothetical protein
LSVIMPSELAGGRAVGDAGQRTEHGAAVARDTVNPITEEK